MKHPAQTLGSYSPSCATKQEQAEQMLTNAPDLTQRQIAEAVGCSIETVRNAARAAGLIKPVRRIAP